MENRVTVSAVSFSNARTQKNIRIGIRSTWDWAQINRVVLFGGKIRMVRIVPYKGAFLREDITNFAPSEKSFMMNFRVENLVGLLEELKKERVQIVGKTEEYDYGKFGWIIDSEGHKIELWEPVDKAFQ